MNYCNLELPPIQGIATKMRSLTKGENMVIMGTKIFRRRFMEDREAINGSRER